MTNDHHPLHAFAAAPFLADVIESEVTSLPASVASFDWLTSLNLSHNHIAALPSSIGRCHALETLDLFSNRIEFLPRAISALPRIRVRVVVCDCVALCVFLVCVCLCLFVFEFVLCCSGHAVLPGLKPPLQRLAVHWSVAEPPPGPSGRH